MLREEVLTSWTRLKEIITGNQQRGKLLKERIYTTFIDTQAHIVIDREITEEEIIQEIIKLKEKKDEELNQKITHWRNQLNSLKEEANKPRPTRRVADRFGRESEDTRQWKNYFNSLRDKINDLVLPVDPNEDWPTIEEVD